MCCGWSWQGGAEAGRDAHCPNGMGPAGNSAPGEAQAAIAPRTGSWEGSGRSVLGSCFLLGHSKAPVGISPSWGLAACPVSRSSAPEPPTCDWLSVAHEHRAGGRRRGAGRTGEPDGDSLVGREIGVLLAHPALSCCAGLGDQQGPGTEPTHCALMAGGGCEGWRSQDWNSK